MKRILSILLAIATFSTMAFADNDLQSILNAKSADCPISLSEGMTLTSASADGGAIVYVYTIDSAKVDFANLKSQKEMLHDVMASDIATTKNADTRRLASYCQANNTNIILRFTNSASGDSFSITLTPSDLSF